MLKREGHSLRADVHSARARHGLGVCGVERLIGHELLIERVGRVPIGAQSQLSRWPRGTQSQRLLAVKGRRAEPNGLVVGRGHLLDFAREINIPGLIPQRAAEPFIVLVVPDGQVYKRIEARA